MGVGVVVDVLVLVSVLVLVLVIGGEREGPADSHRAEAPCFRAFGRPGLKAGARSPRPRLLDNVPPFGRDFSLANSCFAGGVVGLSQSRVRVRRAGTQERS